MISSAHAAVSINEAVNMLLVTGGRSQYQSRTFKLPWASMLRIAFRLLVLLKSADFQLLVLRKKCECMSAHCMEYSFGL